MSVIVEYGPCHVLLPPCSEGVLAAWLLDWGGDSVGLRLSLPTRVYKLREA